MKNSSRKSNQLLNLVVILTFILFIGKIYYTKYHANIKTSKQDMTTDTTTSGLEVEYISKSIQPGDDFYKYTNEGWLNTKEIPKGFPALNSFHDLYIKTEDQVEQIISGLLDKSKDNLNHEQKMIVDLYQSYKNIDVRNKLKLEPIDKGIKEILAITDKQDILKFMAKPSGKSFINVYVELDQKNPDKYILYLVQGGLGLPNRDYYLLDKDGFKSKRKSYLEYITNILNLVKVKNSNSYAKKILELETLIARAQWPVEQTRDAIKNYNLMSIDELIKFTPGYDWQYYLNQYGVNDVEQVVVGTDTAVQKIANIFKKQDVELLKNYLVFHYISAYADYLSEDIEKLHFDFYSKQMNGIAEQRPLDKRVLAELDSLLGEIIGHLYVQQYFSPEMKNQILEYCEYFRQTFKDRLTNNNWMDDATTQEALAKLQAFTFKIGYPDKWRDYSSLEISDDSIINNIQNIMLWERADSLKKLAEPKRDWEWYMSANTINAYYDQIRNEIVFPAAILQAPFYSYSADPAINFGGIGAVIGHEMGHGFDDQGSKYNSKGILENWWSDSSRDKFEVKTKKLVAQYDNYSPIEGMHVNGEFTLGENIGDLGGLSIAYNAYHNYIKDNYSDGAPVIDSFTGEQRLFLAWGVIWRAIETKDFIRQRLLADPHSPNQYRVNGVVRNMDSWYDAFGIKDDNALYISPEDRVSIW